MNTDPTITDTVATAADTTAAPAPTTIQDTPAPVQDTPAADTSGDTTPQPSEPAFTPEAFAKLDAAYALSEPEPDTSGDTSGDTAAADDYTITFPDSFAEHPEAAAFSSILAPIAQQSGMESAAFGKLFADSYAAIENARQQTEWKNRYQQDADLKRDWGADYEANMRTARGHIAFLKQRAGLSDSDLAVFASPKGMRALYAMATAHAAPPAAGLSQTHISEQTWAQAVMQPSHADHDAFTNPMNPRYKEVNQRWLRAKGH